MPEKAAQERKELHGIGVSSGIGLGRARVMAIAPLKLPQYSIQKKQIKSELQRFNKAVAAISKETSQLLSHTPKHAPKEMKSFLEMFRMLVTDETLAEEVKKIVTERLINVEWALAQHLEEVKNVFENMGDTYLSARGDDIEHAINRIQEELLGTSRKIREEIHTSFDEVILVTNNLSLSDVIWLTEYEDLDLVGIITEKGGPTSHTAVLSQTLFIPAVVGVPGARAQIKNGDLLYVDSNQGTILCNPTPTELIKISEQVQKQEELYSELYRIKHNLAITKDKHRVKLLANVAMVNTIEDVLEQGAQGIGLFRSEYMFLGRNKLPDENEQYESYKELIEEMGGREVTIRTLDVGGDKLLNTDAKLASASISYFAETEENPALGLRAIRFSLANPKLFVTQVKAILRAAYKQKVRIMLPLVSSIEEIQEAKRLIASAKRQLESAQKNYNPNVPVGIMIEVPSVAIKAKDFLAEVDFASIGTNDLVQYTMAVDRGNPSVAPIYDECQPAVLWQLANVAKIAQKEGIDVSVCGEMAGKSEFVPIFIGMGFKKLSMAAMQIPKIKHEIRKLTKADCELLVKKLMRQKTAKAVREQLKKFSEQIK